MGRDVLPTRVGWEPGALTNKVATVAHIAPEQHFVALAYDGRAIVVQDSWQGPGATGSWFDAPQAPFGDATLQWAGVFASFSVIAAVCRFEPRLSTQHAGAAARDEMWHGGRQ